MGRFPIPPGDESIKTQARPEPKLGDPIESVAKIVAMDDLFFNSRSKSNVPSAAPIHRITN